MFAGRRAVTRRHEHYCHFLAVYMPRAQLLIQAVFERRPENCSYDTETKGAAREKIIELKITSIVLCCVGLAWAGLGCATVGPLASRCELHVAPSAFFAPHLSATMDSGLPTKLSKTASIALSESSRLAMLFVTAFTSPPKAFSRAGCPSGPFGHPLNFARRRLSCVKTARAMRLEGSRGAVRTGFVLRVPCP